MNGISSHSFDFVNAAPCRDSAYQSAWRYISARGASRFHLRACYEGVSFQKLAQCLLFDKHHQISFAEEYRDHREITLLRNQEGEVSGVRVVCDMVDFASELDFEVYVIADADSKDAYQHLLMDVPQKCKLEIVTLDLQQQEVVQKMFPHYYVHHWNVHLAGKVTCGELSPRLRLLGSEHIPLMRRLDVQFPVECSPHRSLAFQLAGLPYLTFGILDGHGQPEALACVRMYCTTVWEVLYTFSGGEDRSCLPELFGSISHTLQADRTELIWRISDLHLASRRALLRECGFAPLTRELHYHTGTPNVG